jgi:hypothetical protein
VIGFGLKDRFLNFQQMSKYSRHQYFSIESQDHPASCPVGAEEVRGKPSKCGSGYSVLSKAEVINAGSYAICSPYFGIVLNPRDNFAYVLILVCDSDL